MYNIRVKRSVMKKVDKLRSLEQDKFRLLLADLRDRGAIQKGWPNFSPLGNGSYHCHLSYNWVACWTWDKDTIEIEVYYVGSREEAPY